MPNYLSSYHSASNKILQGIIKDKKTHSLKRQIKNQNKTYIKAPYLELPDRKFKIVMINMLGAPSEKGENMQEQMEL